MNRIILPSDVFDKRLSTIQRHIKHVTDNCNLMGERLIQQGERDFALLLMANGQIHDNSKLRGIEWEYLNSETKEENPEQFAYAALHHVSTNEHHPEYWCGIEEMPRIYVAEMVADWAARSQEFGNDLRVWIKEKATDKYNFTCQGKVYKEIKDFVDILLEEKFK